MALRVSLNDMALSSKKVPSKSVARYRTRASQFVSIVTYLLLRHTKVVIRFRTILATRLHLRSENCSRNQRKAGVAESAWSVSAVMSCSEVSRRLHGMSGI